MGRLTKNSSIKLSLLDYLFPPKLGIDSAKRDVGLDIKEEEEEFLYSLNIQQSTREKIEQLLEEEIPVDEERKKIEKILEEETLSQEREKTK